MDFPQYVDKDQLKQQLPLAFACYMLGIHLNEAGKAPCPFHHDTDPSFYLWHGDDGVERWSCQPCGLNGDVYSLITKLRGVSFNDAVTYASSLVAQIPLHPEYTAPAISAPSEGPDDWAWEIKAAQDRARKPEWDGKLSAWTGLADDEDIPACRIFDAFLRDHLLWGCDEFGAAVMPHYDQEGLLTGAKIRDPSGQRVSKQGSRYDALYGAWHPPRRDVLLTEGETDKAWASYQVHNLGLTDVSVYALPRGAGAPPTEEQVSFLKGSRTVFLAFDPDHAGIKATRAWVQALALAGIRNVRCCRLPLGKDLRDARPDIPTMLRSAQTPLREPPMIQALPGGYVVTLKEGESKEITNWTVEPTACLTGGEDGPGYLLLVHHRGQSDEHVIRHTDLASVSKLRAWCAQLGLFFTATDRQVGLVAEHLEWRASLVPEIFQTSRVGWHGPPDAYAFAGPSVVYPGGYSGTLPWMYAPGPKKADLTGQILLPGDGGRFEWAWLEAFLSLSDPSITHPLLSWICAAARRPEVRDFPILFMGGPSGSGKSTLAKLAIRMAGSRVESPLGGITPYILMQRLSSTTSVPIFVDEWTRLSRKDTREALQGLIPLIYEGAVAERGSADLTSTSYRMTSPMIVAGEDTLHLDREIDRVVAVQPQESWQNFPALAAIAGQPLERFGNMLHWFVTSSGAPLPPLAPLQSADRPTHNKQVLLGGWLTLLAMLEHARDIGEDVPTLPDIPMDPNPVEGMGVDDRENIYEKAVHGAAPFRDSSGNPLCWPDVEGLGTWVRFEALIKVVESNLDIELPGRSKAALQYFRGRYKVTASRSKAPDSFKEFRAHLLHGFFLVPQAQLPSYPEDAS